MKFSQSLLALTTFGTQVVLAATPPGSVPEVDPTVGLVYGRNNVSPGERFPIPDVQTQPAVYLDEQKRNRHVAAKAQGPKNKNKDQTYTFALVDLDIPYFALPPTTDFSSLVPGLGPNRTTRLHWWEWDVASSRHGQLYNQSVAIADYQGPAPPAGDTPHDYVLYLFKQPKGWTPPVGARDMYMDSAKRMNFSVTALVEEFGVPVAANYITAQNTSAAATATG